MNFDLTAEQKMLKKSAREFFSKEVDGSLIRELEAGTTGHHDKIWRKMARLGWQGLIVPETFGGEGMTFSDMAVVLEEMGSSALPGPFFTSCVASALVLLEAGSEDQKKRFLADLSTGKKIFTVGWCETHTDLDPYDISTKAVLIDNQYEITGMKCFIPYAHLSDYLIIAARTGEPGETGDAGISLFIIDRKSAGVSIDIVSNSSGEKVCEVILEKVRIPSENLIGELNQGWKILEPLFMKFAVAESAKMVGAANTVIKMVLEYAKKREQFGRPIGSFQAIQHHCANMKTYLDTSELLTQQASWRISTGADWKMDASICKAWAGEALRKMIMLGHQVMGGFGFVEEVDVQLYYRRARTAEILFGNSAYHREKVASEMGL